MRAGTAGCGGFGGGGGARARAGGGRGARKAMTGGPHPSARVAARLSAARARGRSRWAGGEEREGGKRSGPSRPQKGRRGGKRTSFRAFRKYTKILQALFDFYVCTF
uniref:Uncharacterized protein n=1 Tax=Oryza sativa subsp. japonica TaxID=39947 RepID=Q6Z5S2_ORYSJ|nr:hypothetical protein [Oryza sativa Japonica Group]